MAKNDFKSTNIMDFSVGAYFIPARSSMIYQMVNPIDEKHADVIAINTQSSRFGAKFVTNKDFSKSDAPHFVQKSAKYIWDRLWSKMRYA